MVGRLIEQENVRLGDPRPRQHGKSLPATAQLFQMAMTIGFRHQHGIKIMSARQLSLSISSTGRAESTASRIVFPEAGGQVLVDDGLRQPAQPGDITAGSVQFTGKAIQQGGFAVAIRGDDADAVSGIHGEAKIGKSGFPRMIPRFRSVIRVMKLSLAKRICDEPWSATMQYGISVRGDPS